jgi:hypothetical protein
MVATSVNNERAQAALMRVRDIVEEYGNNEQKERLNRIQGGPVPAPRNYHVEHETYQSEALAVLFEMVGELLEANRPKKRGRKPNIQYHDEESQ